MKYLATAVLIFALLGAQTAIATDYDSTVSNFRNAGTGAFIDQSYGYAVFPTIGKGGIGIGGAHGKGGVFVGGKGVRQGDVAPGGFRHVRPFRGGGSFGPIEGLGR